MKKFTKLLIINVLFGYALQGISSEITVEKILSKAVILPSKSTPSVLATLGFGVLTALGGIGLLCNIHLAYTAKYNEGKLLTGLMSSVTAGLFTANAFHTHEKRIARNRIKKGIAIEKAIPKNVPSILPTASLGFLTALGGINALLSLFLAYHIPAVRVKFGFLASIVAGLSIANGFYTYEKRIARNRIKEIIFNSNK